MKQIPLTQGKFALVDDADFDWLNQWKWHFSHGYAVRREWIVKGRGITVWMHKQILEPARGMITDHRDTNKLNNQRYNLREATKSQNGMNRLSSRGSSSRFKGVSWYENRGKWVSQIMVNGKNKNLGHHLSEIDAAEAHNKAALEYQGEFARLNDLTSHSPVCP